MTAWNSSSRSIPPLSISGEYASASGLRVLLVETDGALRGALQREQPAPFGSMHTCSSGEAALLLLETGAYDVVVADFELQGMTGLELLERIMLRYPDTGVVLSIGTASARGYETARRVGFIRTLSKPVSPADLRQAMMTAVEARDGLVGDLHGLSLIDVLQLYHQGKNSVSLRLGSATIAIREGEVVHAQFGEMAGEEAFKAILTVESGVLCSEALAVGPVTIRRPFNLLILDSLSQLDESRRYDETRKRPEIARSFARYREAFRVEPRPQFSIACASIVGELPRGCACVLLDVMCGAILGVSNPEDADTLLADPVAKSLLASFCEQAARLGSAPRQPGRPGSTPPPGRGPMEEIDVSSATHHYIARALGESAVIVLVVQRETLLGAARAQILAHAQRFQSLLRKDAILE